MNKHDNCCIGSNLLAICDILRFILPCKSNCQPIFGIAQFVTRFTHVKTHFGALSRKLKKNLEKKLVCYYGLNFMREKNTNFL